ncbi:MAG: HEPN domain-containing protein [Candidatus Njordarchaeales archaeon]
MSSYPFTHDLATLLDTLRVLNIDIPSKIIDAAQRLTPHYVLSRYSGKGIFDYNRERAKCCVRDAEVILEWLKSID